MSERLQKAADMVSRGRYLADVGCDHGYVSIYLYKKGICRKCLAMDINKGPLAAARANAASYQAEEGVELRLSDGLKKVKSGECDCALLAGMGGSLMVKILEDSPEITKELEELVLEPQSEPEKVRDYVCREGFFIVEENMTLEQGKYYPIMKCLRKKEKQQLSKAEEKYGPWLIKNEHPLLKELLSKEEKRLSEIAKKLTSSPKGALRLAQIKQEQELIRSIKDSWENANE